MIGLNFLVTWIDRILGLLSIPEPVQDVVWFPVFFLALTIILYHGIRRLTPMLAHLMRAIVVTLVAMVAAPVMAAIAGIAMLFRSLRRQPPGPVLTADDAVVVFTTRAWSGAGWVASAASKLARTNLFLILVLATVITWRWNDAQCDQPEPSSCVTPVAQWARAVGIAAPSPAETVPPDPVTPSPSA
jgi:hypothetical protein